MIIIESLKVFLFGMAGVFAVMGIIIGAAMILNLLGKKEEEDNSAD